MATNEEHIHEVAVGLDRAARNIDQLACELKPIRNDARADRRGKGTVSGLACRGSFDAPVDVPDASSGSETRGPLA
jgi:hypothetical protein